MLPIIEPGDDTHSKGNSSILSRMNDRVSTYHDYSGKKMNGGSRRRNEFDNSSSPSLPQSSLLTHATNTTMNDMTAHLARKLDY